MDDSVWRSLARAAAGIAGTPCYFMHQTGVREALDALRRMPTALTVRHWLSLKTQPVKPLLQAWSGWGLGIEVVSEFELAAAVSSGVPPSRILVNGVAKHTWLPAHAQPNLVVHLDSVAEAEALAPFARRLNWTVGIRCQVPDQRDPDDGQLRDQFGMTPNEVIAALGSLSREGVAATGLHFHIHTNVRSATAYARAVDHLRSVCNAAEWEPLYIDVGGGLPVPNERPRGPGDAPLVLVEDLAHVVNTIPELFPNVKEVWLENGRFISAGAGALVVRVLDRKARCRHIHLICDGGRTNHARLSAVEVHRLLVDPERPAIPQLTTVCGPTCGSVDQLGRWMLPSSVEPGDLLIWLNAGAYHLPLETRFSFGLAPFVWFDAAWTPYTARRRETPEQWWSQWN